MTKGQVTGTEKAAVVQVVDERGSKQPHQSRCGRARINGFFRCANQRQRP